MVKATLIALSLVSMFSGSNSEGFQLPEGQSAGRVETKTPQATASIRTENQCVAAAIAKILEEVQSANFPRAKWRIDLEFRKAADQALSLLVDVEPIDLDPGGGGRFTYDCETGHLSLIEDFR